jgi:hypothetical protein
VGGMTGLGPIPPPRTLLERLVKPAALAMLIFGLVSVVGSPVALPAEVIAPALLIGLAAAGVFCVSSWRQARATGRGLLRAMGRAIWDTIRLVFEIVP